ncbi:MAG: gamma-glutamyl-gamma-aminobutyrate hydrolase family protein [Planctomycetia bacterium]|nr:gamma-glutamyl-gamma-aminobutyrate hydrolase family protein [Planctomycetia bacterium]
MALKIKALQPDRNRLFYFFIDFVAIFFFVVSANNIGAEPPNKSSEIESFKPLIGITASLNQSGSSACSSANQTYIDVLSQNNGVPIILPFVDSEEVLNQMVDRLDGLLLTGGIDVDPSFYGAEPIKELEASNLKLDIYESRILKRALERRIPILGICRGHQFLNVYFHGTLYQDIPSQCPESISHRKTSNEKKIASHLITIEKESQFHQLIGVDSLRVNSSHHQSVDRLGDGFRIVARTSDGIVEAIERDDYPFMISVQWHPELMVLNGDSTMNKIFVAFIESCSPQTALSPLSDPSPK